MEVEYTQEFKNENVYIPDSGYVENGRRLPGKVTLEQKWQEMTKELVLAKMLGKELVMTFRGDPHGEMTMIGKNLIDDFEYIKLYYKEHPLCTIELREKE